MRWIGFGDLLVLLTGDGVVYDVFLFTFLVNVIIIIIIFIIIIIIIISIIAFVTPFLSAIHKKDTESPRLSK